METTIEEQTCTAAIHGVLCRLGITPNYLGFFHAAYGALLAAVDPQRLLLVTKWIYPAVAKRYGTTCKAVERNIRSAIAIAWKCNPGLLMELSGFQRAERPKNAQFLAMLAAHCTRSVSVETPAIE